MKVLMLSTDKKILEDKSEARKRMLDFGEIFEELHIIVYTKASGIGHRALDIGNNVFIYSTNTKFRPFYFWDVYKIAKLLVVSRKLSVITAQDPFETGLAGWFLKLKFKLPLQLQIHADIFSPYFFRESLKNKLRVWLAEFLLPKADGIRVVSERIKQSLLTLYPKPSTLNPIVVLSVFVDVKKIQSAKIKINLHQKYPDYDFIILMASRLTAEKNIAMAISAMPEVIKNHPKTLLLIVGDGPKREALNRQLTTDNLQQNVKIEPWSNDLISYYKSADLFLLTSNYEGYGRTIVEAMAAGLPVLMTDVGLAGELLIDDLDGRIVAVGDVGQLTHAILELRANAAKREEFKLNTSKLLENWPAKEEYLEKYKNSLDFKTVLN